MEKHLYIIAAGVSSRMGGSPKHLCNVGGISNLENTLNLSYKYFDSVTVVINKNLDDGFKRKNMDIVSKYSNAYSIEIESGKGDLHAIVETLCETKDHSSDIYCVWGDTYFKDDTIFKAMKEQTEPIRKDACVGVFCALEKTPYAYIIDCDDTVMDSGFSGDLKRNDIMLLHDQSAFRINPNLLIYCFALYKNAVQNHIENIEKFIKLKNIEYEFSIIKFISSIHKISDYVSIIYKLNEPVGISFNTVEELENLNRII